MNILILGFGSIARRRALPAMLAMDEIERIDIASHHLNGAAELPETWSDKIFNDYGDGLSESDAGLVYIPLVNALHENWISRALDTGRHVIAEKPACLSQDASRSCLDKASKAGLCVAESVVFADHPQFTKIKNFVGDNGGATRINAVFSFPPLPEDNFRNSPELGGGAINDIGPYGAAVSRLFFGDAPEDIHCAILTRRPARQSGAGAETAISIMANYSGGRSLLAQFGFDTEYQNKLTVTGPGCSVTAERVFSTPPELENRLVMNRRNQQTTMTVDPADSFVLFFQRVLGAIAAGDWSRLTDALDQDSRFLERLRKAAK